MRHQRLFLLLVMCLGIVVGLSANEIKISGGDTLLLIPKAKSAPVIDGDLDPAWRGVSETYLRSYDNGTSLPTDKSDLYGTFRLMWDDNNMYGFFTTWDEVLHDADATSWTNDSWEVYFDADNSKGATYDGVNDMQIRFEHKDVASTDIDGGGVWSSSSNSAVFKIKDITVDGAPIGYVLEFAIPLTDLKLDGLGAGSIIGFEAQQNDNDGSGREHISKFWLEVGDNSWQDPSLFGLAQLVDVEADSILPIYKTSSAPTIDGDLDDVWISSSDAVSMNSYKNGTGLPTSPDDLWGEFRLMWDDNNMYGFFTTWDEVLHDADATSWTNDSWEVYFDADNSKGATYDGVNDMQIRFEHKDVASTDIDGGGVWSASSNSAVFKIKDIMVEGAPVGYTLEFAIPLTDLKLDGLGAGSIIGFEAQQNDNDGSGRESISKWYLQEGDNSWQNPSLFGNAVLKGAKGSTSVKSRPASTINDYALSQNYPNPFNPSTKIDYTVAKTGYVKLSVYNMLGKEVATLVDGVKTAGTHTARFNATNLSSGVYFYKLQAGNTVLTNKMVFLK